MGHIVYHMCIAAVLFVGGTYASQPSETQPSDMQTIPLLWSLSPAYLQSLRVGMDQETLNYLLPRLSAKYKPNNSWSDIADPRFYVLSELGTQEYDKQDSSNIMPKRNSLRSNGHTLSIVQPLDVLRQRMLLEIARRKVLEQAQKVEENRAYLKTIGKRSVDRQSLHQYQSL